MISTENKVYWANDLPEHVVKMCQTHITNWGGYDGPATNIFTTVASSWRRNLIAYYSPMVKAQDWTTSLGYTGDQGELVDMTVPVSRTVLRQYISLLTKQRLAFEVDSNTLGSNALQVARIGKQLCNYYTAEQDLEAKIFRAAEATGVFGAGYITCTWRNDSGYLLSTDKGNPNMSGANCFENPDITEVIYDWSVKYKDSPYAIFKMRRNRWDIATQFPDKRDDILNAPTVYQSRRFLTDLDFIPMYVNTDMIYVYEFYHKPCPALPDGRSLFFVEGGKWIYDDINLYRGIPGIQFMFEDMLGTGLGYPMLSSMLPAQEMFDHSLSVEATNQAAFGVQSVLTPKGSDISAAQIQGLNFITYSPQNIEGGGKPEALQLTKTPPEVGQFRDALGNLIESTGYLNAAIRGNPPPGVTAGTAIATLSANAQEFMSSAATSIITGLEDLLGLALRNDQKFAPVEYLESIVGKSSAYMLKSFKDDDTAFKQVRAKTTNPLMNTVSGRMQIAELAIQTGKINDVQKLFNILDGAPAEILYESELDEGISVRNEIDAVLSGQTVIPLITDNHPLFIRALKAILYQSEVRRDSALTDAVTMLIQERVRLENQCPPELKMMLRGPADPSVQMMMAAPPPQASASGIPVPKEPQQQEQQNVPSEPAPVAQPPATV